MNLPSTPPTQPDQPQATAPESRLRWLRTSLICLVIVALGIAGASYIMKTAPRAQKRPPQRTLALVRTQPLAVGTHQVTVTGMGTVIPAREITLKARVGGQIESRHPEFVEGGLIRAGQKVVKIAPEDYALAITTRESAVVDAEYALNVEMGYQDVARREWSLLNPGQPTDDPAAALALRKPHLAKAQSDLVAARAQLEQARLELGRTDVVAPFNAIVREKYVAVGSQITTQDALADLVGTDEYWVQVSLPVDRLAWIRIPRTRAEEGAPVTLLYRGNRRQGTVIRLLGDLESEGRMARILVSVDDPLGLKAAESSAVPPLLIGEYVKVEIAGRQLNDVYRIPRSALRDNGTIWVLEPDDTLAILPVDTVWRDADHVLIKDGLAAGQRLIVSDLATPVAGMSLKENADETTAAGQTGTSPAGDKSDG